MPSKNNNKTTTDKKKLKPTCGKKPQPQTINSDDEISDELYSHDTAFNTKLRTNFFKDITFIVDRLHKQGHVGKWCLGNCHPKLFPELDGYNTQVCEQLNSWLSKYKYILKHMSLYRYNFFLYIIF